jgi:lysophospholipase L1-like esterase
VSHRRPGRVLAAATAVVVVGLLITPAPVDGIAPATLAQALLGRGHRDVPADTVTFAVVGDSISAWDPSYANAHPWQDGAATLPLAFVGGWAVPGATTTQMLAESAGRLPEADVLVIMAGTNDLLPEVTDHRPASTLVRIDAIVRASGATRVVLSAVAPNDLRPDETAVLNAHLAALARLRGWTWVDPWVEVRSADGTYVEATTTDGIHPRPATARRVGIAMHTAIVDAALGAPNPAN